LGSNEVTVQDDYDGPIRSVLRLFLSVDLVGSTALKQSHQTALKTDDKTTEGYVSEPWFSPIAQFYKQIERLFAREWQAYVDGAARQVGWPTGSAPQLWKSAGDELLYIKVIEDHREAWACVACWKRAIDEYRSQLVAQYPSLDLKCTAWTAGFPIINTEIVFSKKLDLREIGDDDDPLYINLYLLHEFEKDPDSPNLTKDFIGPSVDTGFRLCALSTPRKFVVSVELAIMLVQAIRSKPTDIAEMNLNFRYDGRVSLKGVLGGKQYPIFWIDMANDTGIERLEDRLITASNINTDDIKAFCEAFFTSHSSSIMIPYIRGSSDPYFAKIPKRHIERLTKLREYWERESERRRIELDSGAQAGEGDDVAEEDLNKLVSEISAKMDAGRSI
jgi:hypothetical protein